MEEEKVTLKSGKCVVIKLPPMNLDFMQNMQRTIVRQALTDPAVMAVLTADEIQELSITVSDINQKYWAEKVLEILGGKK